MPVPPSIEWMRLNTVLRRNPPVSIRSADLRLSEESSPQQEMTAPVRPSVTWGSRSKLMRGLKKRKEIQASSATSR